MFFFVFALFSLLYFFADVVLRATEKDLSMRIFGSKYIFVQCYTFVCKICYALGNVTAIRGTVLECMFVFCIIKYVLHLKPQRYSALKLFFFFFCAYSFSLES